MLAGWQCVKWSGLSSMMHELCAARTRAEYLCGCCLLAGQRTLLACSVPLPGCKFLSLCCPGLGIAVNLHLPQVRDTEERSKPPTSEILCLCRHKLIDGPHQGHRWEDALWLTLPPVQPSALHNSHLCREHQLQAALCPAKAQKLVACSCLQCHALLQRPYFMHSHQMLADLWDSRQLTDIMAQAHTRKVFTQDLQPGRSRAVGLGLLDNRLGSFLLEAWQMCVTCCVPGSDSHCNMISCPACTPDKVCSANSTLFYLF